MYVCVYVCVYVCMYVCMYRHTHVCIYICTTARCSLLHTKYCSYHTLTTALYDAFTTTLLPHTHTHTQTGDGRVSLSEYLKMHTETPDSPHAVYRELLRQVYQVKQVKHAIALSISSKAWPSTKLNHYI
jgi:hypothetical protein